MGIHLKQISLIVKDQTLLNNIYLELNEDILYHLSGEMGVGKTTFLEFLAKNYKEYPPKSGILCNYIENQRILFEELTVIENLKFYKRLFKCTESDFNYILVYFNIEEMLYKTISELSSGNQQLIYLVCSFMNTESKLLLIDEPFVNLDIDTKNRVLNYLESIKIGKIIVFTSHEFSSNSIVYTKLRIENEDILCFH